MSFDYLSSKAMSNIETYGVEEALVHPRQEPLDKKRLQSRGTISYTHLYVLDLAVLKVGPKQPEHAWLCGDDNNINSHCKSDKRRHKTHVGSHRSEDPVSKSTRDMEGSKWMSESCALKITRRRWKSGMAFQLGQTRIRRIMRQIMTESKSIGSRALETGP